MISAIETPRLQLRPMTAEHFEAYARIRTDPHVARFLPPQDRVVVLGRAMAGARSWQEHGYGPFSVIDRATGRFLGRINVQLRQGTDELDLGWILRRDAWGHGFAYEATRAVIAWSFGTLEVDYLTAWVRPQNARSVRMAERLGMSLLRTEGAAGQHQYVYALARDWWQELPEREHARG